MTPSMRRMLMLPVTMAPVVMALSACAPTACRNPYVLDFVDAADHRSDLAHLGLVRDAVRSEPTATATQSSCSIWEQVRNPAYGRAAASAATVQPPILVRPQHFLVTEVNGGWRVDGLP